MNKCRKCYEPMVELMITDGPTFSNVWINYPGDSEEKVRLYSCDSADCANVGIVLMIPTISKED